MVLLVAHFLPAMIGSPLSTVCSSSLTSLTLVPLLDAWGGWICNWLASDIPGQRLRPDLLQRQGTAGPPLPGAMHLVAAKPFCLLPGYPFPITVPGVTMGLCIYAYCMDTGAVCCCALVLQWHPTALVSPCLDK